MKYLFIASLCTAMVACNVSDKKTADAEKSNGTPSATEMAGLEARADSSKSTTLQWVDPVVQDLGAMQQGQIAEVSWKFKNTGTHPLYITNVRAGCGCTTPDIPKEPIAPGQESVIKAKFNSQNFSGHVTKEVFVQANNTNPNNGSDNKLTFTADIK